MSPSLAEAPKPKDGWDRAGVVGNIALGFATVLISGLAAYFAHQASANTDEFNRRQAELRTAEVLQKALDGFRAPSPTAGPAELPARGAPVPAPVIDDNRELTRIVLAAQGKPAIPIVQLLLSSQVPRLQEEGKQVALYLHTSHPELRSELLSDLIGFARSGDRSLRMGAAQALILIGKSPGALADSAGNIISMLKERYSPASSAKADAGLAVYDCQLLGTLSGASSAEILLQILTESASTYDVRVAALNNLMAVSSNSGQDRAVAERVRSRLPSVSGAGWDEFSLKLLANLKKKVGLS